MPHRMYEFRPLTHADLPLIKRWLKTPHVGEWWHDPAGQFELVSGKDDLATYEFNTHTAKHTFCKVCGIHAFYVPRSDPDKIDVNARCIDGIDLATLPLKYFDGQNWEQAMEKEVPWR